MLLTCKRLAISSIAVVGIVPGMVRSQQSSQPSAFKWFEKDPDIKRQTMPIWTSVGDYITATYGALFCSGGWETVSLGSQ